MKKEYVCTNGMTFDVTCSVTCIDMDCTLLVDREIGGPAFLGKCPFDNKYKPFIAIEKEIT